MQIHLYLLCFNEEIMLPKTVEHYKRYIPNCKITIYDNESTDNSVNIARSLGCSIVSWNSNNEINDIMYRDIKNKCWKDVHDGWIIVADMDEWLCVSEQDLIEEYNQGTTILTVKGFNMIGDSKRVDLKDIDVHGLTDGIYCIGESKRLCFLREKIQEMNYSCGAHRCNPTGEIVYSEKIYINKHMVYLGLDFWINKNKVRFVRATSMQKIGLAVHYSDNDEILNKKYIQRTNPKHIINIISCTNEYLHSLPEMN